MTKAEKILEKHLKLNDVETMLGKHGTTHKAVINAINEAIDYTHSCTELNHEDLAIGEQVRITQTKLVEINFFREDGDIDVEDTVSVFTVGLNEISKVV